jgi:hypothetical protein
MPTMFTERQRWRACVTRDVQAARCRQIRLLHHEHRSGHAQVNEALKVFVRHVVILDCRSPGGQQLLHLYHTLHATRHNRSAC